ncbi:unnamed protein product [Parnassius apollo]|uniref:(apollo) hypothetical protein n=1 Tax=Parnassius apollo TaxID=110799 RepID=A0A8S3WZL4_PARAO|nr:unnamed protein product [Parnassius apollo]
MTDVLKALLLASEKAACIARSCTEANEALLVTEKSENEANTRFTRDFKTIADVLAQECAKAEIAKCLPALSKHLRGEERNEIGGVTITLQGSEEETAELLGSLIPQSTATQMAKAAHAQVNQTFTEALPNIPMLDYENLGVWIDPIDGTAEFIAGVQGKADANNGLSCVTVLIGAYLRSSGEPIIGVINQPFYNSGNGRMIWGVNYNGIKHWNGGGYKTKSDNKTVLISSAEKLDIIQKLKSSGWKVKSVPGAGNKLLKVAIGEAAAYVVSQGTTFRWDTCAPHAVLNARGGGLVSFSTHCAITYNDATNIDTKEYCNSEGIIACGEQSTLSKILSDLN